MNPDSAGVAYASTQPVNIDGRIVELQAYALADRNGNQTNYVKLRDLGHALGFNVGWSAGKGIFIETGKPYDVND